MNRRADGGATLLGKLERGVPGDKRHDRRLPLGLVFRPSAPLHRLVLVAALTIPWGLVTALRATPIPPNAPPALDRFLADVAMATPPRTRLLVAGQPSALVFYRATYGLYPRAVVGYLVRPYTAIDGWVGAPATWSAAVRFAQRKGAQFIALWGSEVTPPATAILWHRDNGVLARVAP